MPALQVSVCGGILERYYNQILFHRDDEGREKPADYRNVGNNAFLTYTQVHRFF